MFSTCSYEALAFPSLPFPCRDHNTGQLKGDALVSFLKAPSVDLAVNLMDGTSLRPGDNKKLVVRAASAAHLLATLCTALLLWDPLLCMSPPPKHWGTCRGCAAKAAVSLIVPICKARVGRACSALLVSGHVWVSIRHSSTATRGKGMALVPYGDFQVVSKGISTTTGRLC